MRPSPTYSVWKLTCGSADEATAMQQWLSSHIGLNRELTDTVRVAPDGVEQVQTVPHRLGDYFASIRTLRSDPANPVAFRLVFEKWPNSGRYWKDLMVNILQETKAAFPSAIIELDYKGELEPAADVSSR